MFLIGNWKIVYFYLEKILQKEERKNIWKQ